VTGFPRSISESVIFEWLEKCLTADEYSEIQSVNGNEGKALIKFMTKRGIFR